MKIIGRIIIVNLFCTLLLISSSYAEYPTSTPETIAPDGFNLIDGIKDAFHSSTGSTSSSEIAGDAESMAAGSSSSSSISSINWTGLGADQLASTADNWSGSAVPMNGNGVVFDGTSSKECSWDMTVILASLNINSGYTGKVTIDAYLTIDTGFKWTGNGDDDFASNPANWSGGVVPHGGDDVDFKGTENCIWDINVAPASLRLDPDYTGTVMLNTDISITGNLSVEGGSLNLNGKSLSVDGDLLIGANGTLYATSSTITVKGNWTNRGTFDPGTSTVILNGTNQTIYGSTTFYNLVKITSVADTLYFEAGSTQTKLNNLVLQGASDNLLSLRSTQEGQSWYINPQGPRSVSFVDIKNMHNLSPVLVIITDSVDSGYNNNVHFGNECVCLEDRRRIC
jgi:hypothetical protein